MDITKEDVSKVLSYFHEVQENPSGLELEDIIRQGRVSKYEFSQLLQYFKSVNKTGKVQEDVLSINFRYKNVPYRYDITGSKEIAVYCKTNNIKTVTRKGLINKSWVQGKYPITIKDYDFRLNLKHEVDINEKEHTDLVQSIQDTLFSFKKFFRFKKRFSFLSEDGLFRYDFTVVKSSRNEALNLVSSEIFSAEETYEVEMEYVGDAKSDDEFLKCLFRNHALLLSIMDDDDHIISATKKENVLKNYIDLCYKEELGKINPKMSLTKYFAGPMPVTLEVRNLVESSKSAGVDNIMNGYTVTDKADGERHLLYFDIDGHGYLINNRMRVRYTGVYNESLKNSLLDGEYITRALNGDPMKLYAIFDVYFVNKENVAKLRLEDKERCRITEMKKIATSSFSGDKDFKIIAKTFKFIGDIRDASESILNQSRLGLSPYKIDGLIYTPRSLPVGAIHENSQPHFGGPWMKVFKWKPPHENTIDFLVVTDKNKEGSDIVISTDMSYAKAITLYVGFKREYTEKITPHKFLTNAITKRELEEYVPVPFKPQEEIFDNIYKTFIELDDANAMRCENGDIIYNNSVVEFAYKGKQWKPLRVRKDKKMGNDYMTAVNIWRSINNPVTEGMICRKEPIPENVALNIDDDMYYNRAYSRDKSATKSMLDFHNDWVKNRSLVMKVAKRTDNVFDIACGKGNDFYKYFINGIKTVVGVDKSEDNIINGSDGAYSRVLKEKAKQNSVIPADAKIVFLPMDFSKTIDQAYIDSIKDEETRDIVKLLWGQQTIGGLERYHNLVGRKFDLVACQFAVHYFMENKQTLDALLQNISMVLKDGGYLIGTCLDGQLVDRKFTSEKMDKIEGVLGGRRIWGLEKKYKSFDKDDPSKNFGLKIDVYMETINNTITEYLVDFRNLEAQMARYGIVRLSSEESQELLGKPESTGTFEELFIELMKSGINTKHTNKARKMTGKEQDYSFMNRWFVMKRVFKD